MALKKSGYNEELKYNSTNGKTSRKRKKKNILWFTPPFNKQVKTNIGKLFLKLIDKHFPRNSSLGKTFNRTNLKISYSCTENIERIIKKHNNKVLNPKPVQNKMLECNCRKKEQCPLQGNCQVDKVIYKATIMPENKPEDKKHYIGLASTEFKARLANHKQTFDKPLKKSDTALSIEFWRLDGLKLKPQVTWEIIARASTPRSLTENCQLCTRERLEILRFRDSRSLLNKRNEIATKCVQKKDYALLNYENK